jgi:hypothetical protein
MEIIGVIFFFAPGAPSLLVVLPAGNFLGAP